MPQPVRCIGFTLVEMLLVVAVLSLLIAILLPTLTKSRELTRRVTCASNMRQLHNAFSHYGIAHHNKLPRMHRRWPNFNEMDHVSWTSPYMFNLLRNTYGAELTAFTCPNRGLEFIKLDGTGWRVGYYFILGRNQNIWSPLYEPWTSPQTTRSLPSLVVTSDVLERNTVTPNISSASHGPSGRVEGPPTLDPSQLGSEGANQARLDGSVLWTRDNLLKRHPASSGGGPQGFW